MRKSIKTFQLRIIHSRSYKHFSNDLFKECLPDKLSEEIKVNNDNGLQKFMMSL